MDYMVRSGRVRYVGHCNFSSWETVEAAWIAKAEHLTQPISAQVEYNLLERNVEKDTIPVCQKYGIGVIPFYPLASGFLTGKYRAGEPPPENARLATPSPIAEQLLSAQNFDLLAQLEAFASECGHSLLELAMSWLASKPYVASVIAGATQPYQVEENTKAASWRLTADEMEQVDKILTGSERRSEN